MSAAENEIVGPPTCPYCGNENPILVGIETGMRVALETNGVSGLPESVCDGCYGQLSKMVSKGAALRAEAAQKQQNRLKLWKNRVAMVKKAKALMVAKSFSDAAVAYEKYLRALEIVYDKKSGELTPELFKADTRQTEITVIASVYWDLMRVYDTHPRYAERQMGAARKLAEFARFSPAFSHIVRKAESQTRTAKNTAAFKLFMKLSNSNRPRCFIATAAFNGTDPTVEALCEFRDRRLVTTPLGRAFVASYYKISPPIARALDAAPFAKPPTRAALRLIARLTRRL